MNLSHNLSLLTKSIGTRLGYDDSHSNLGNEFNALKSDAKAFRAEIERISAAAQVCGVVWCGVVCGGVCGEDWEGQCAGEGRRVDESGRR